MIGYTNIEFLERLGKVIKQINAVAEKQTWDEIASKDGELDVDIHGFFGENVNDAYYEGFNIGKIIFARHLQDILRGE